MVTDRLGVTLVLGHVRPLNGQQEVAPRLLDEAHRLVHISRHLGRRNQDYKERVCLSVYSSPMWQKVKEVILFLTPTLLLILSILSFSLSPALWLWPPGTILATNTPTYIINIMTSWTWGVTMNQMNKPAHLILGVAVQSSVDQRQTKSLSWWKLKVYRCGMTRWFLEYLLSICTLVPLSTLMFWVLILSWWLTPTLSVRVEWWAALSEKSSITISGTSSLPPLLRGLR